MTPFQMKSQMLRQLQLEPTTALEVFSRRSEEVPDPKAPLEAAPKSSWKQSDVKRLLNAAEQAGLDAYRVEVAPDGTLSIIVGAPEDTAAPAKTAID